MTAKTSKSAKNTPPIMKESKYILKGKFIMKLFDDYKNLVVKPQQEFIKRHRKAYLLAVVASFCGSYLYNSRESIKNNLKKKFSRKSKVKES